jgi:beta-glucosidase/6-phospho-beta-glucosidase/beta-galactosidase
MIDALIENGIEPMVTMFHWDLPQFIQDIGGFANPIFVDYFKHYADILFQSYGTRVKQWITFNEPFNVCVDGYGVGKIAPGMKASGVGEYLCAHHVLLAHATAYKLYKEKYFGSQKGQIGISLNSRYVYPKDESVDKSLVEKVVEFRVFFEETKLKLVIL